LQVNLHPLAKAVKVEKTHVAESRNMNSDSSIDGEVPDVFFGVGDVDNAVLQRIKRESCWNG